MGPISVSLHRIKHIFSFFFKNACFFVVPPCFCSLEEKVGFTFVKQFLTRRHIFLETPFRKVNMA